MATGTYKIKCQQCESPVFYYPAQLVLDASDTDASALVGYEQTRVLVCACTGELGGVKHTMTYEFPGKFEKVG